LSGVPRPRPCDRRRRSSLLRQNGWIEATTVADPSSEDLPRNVVVLSWVSFFQDAASEMLYPVLPLFVTGVLGAPPAALGLIEGVAEATQATTKIAAGQLADRQRRRPLIGAGYTISGLAKPIIGLATGWPLVLFARFTDRVGKGLRGAPRDALIASETPQALRGRAFGLHRAMDSTGAVVGPLLGLLLYHALGQRLRPLFFFALIPAAISVALVFLVREKSHPVAQRAGHRRAPPGPLGRRYWTALVLLTAFALLNFSDALVLLRTEELGLGFGAVIASYALYNAVYAGLSYPAGHLSDRIPRPAIVATGLGVFSVAYLGLGLASNSAWVWVLLPLYGAYTALTDGVGKAWLADLSPATHMGRGMGLFQGVTGFGALIAGIWAGLAWGDDGRVPMLIAGAGAAVVAVVLAIVGRHLDHRPALTDPSHLDQRLLIDTEHAGGQNESEGDLTR